MSREIAFIAGVWQGVTQAAPRAQPLDKVLGIGAFDLKRIVEMEPDFLGEEGHHHTHDSAITSVGIMREGSLDLDRLNAWMGKLLKEKGVDIYRSKGVLSISENHPLSSSP